MSSYQDTVARWAAGDFDRAEMERQIAALARAGRNDQAESPTQGPRFRPSTQLQIAADTLTGGRCWYCGEPGDSIDHQIPRSKGGPNTTNNCVLACRSCNSKKRTRTVEEFRVYMMIVHGRPPSPFIGERPAHGRDWLIVCDNPVVTPRRRDLFAQKLSTFMRDGSA